VTLLFNHGRFDETGVALVASTLLLLLFALPAESLITIVVRAFYADRDTRTPAAAALLAMALSIAIAVLAVRELGLGLAGIGVGIAVGTSVEVVVLIAILQRRFGGFEPRSLAALALRVGAASAIAAGVAYAVVTALGGPLEGSQVHLRAFVELAAGGGLGGLAYLLVARLLRLPELGLIVRLMTDTLARLRPA
jgi:putative peptidoglycan lipid II flippase